MAGFFLLQYIVSEYPDFCDRENDEILLNWFKTHLACRENQA